MKEQLIKRSMLLALVVVSLSACEGSNEAKDDPQAYLQKGLQSFTDIQSAEYEIKSEGVIKGGEDDMQMEFMLSGWWDATGEVYENSTMGDFFLESADDGKFEVDKLELRLRSLQDIYLRLEGFNFETEEMEEDDALMLKKLEDYMGMWIEYKEGESEYNLMEELELRESLGEFYDGQESQMELSEGQLEQIRELVSQAQIFDDVEYEGEEKVLGEGAYKLAVGEIDDEALTELLEDISEITQGQIEGMDEVVFTASMFISILDPEIVIWVGKDKPALRKIEVVIEMPASFKENPDDEMRLEFSLALAKINEDFSLDIPEAEMTVDEVIKEMEDFAKEQGIELDDSSESSYMDSEEVVFEPSTTEVFEGELTDELLMGLYTDMACFIDESDPEPSDDEWRDLYAVVYGFEDFADFNSYFMDYYAGLTDQDKEDFNTALIMQVGERCGLDEDDLARFSLLL